MGVRIIRKAGHKFVDRGDPTDWDFEFADFELDATWRDLDLSSVVPSGAVAVLLRVEVRDDGGNNIFMLRENGNSNNFNVGRITSQVAAVYMRADVIVACDSNRIIEYYGGTTTTWNTVYITIAGWWI